MKAFTVLVAFLASLVAVHAAEITGIYLADAVSDDTLMELTGDKEINLSTMTFDRLTVYALATEDTSRVRLILNGAGRNERRSPYALFGDNPVFEFPDDLYMDLGRNEIVFRVFDAADVLVETRTIVLTIIAGDAAPCTFDVEVDSCDLGTIADAVGDACNPYEFSLAFTRACETARAEADAGTPLSELIPEFDEQDVDNYFNGGTYWNQNTGDLADEAPIIEELYETYAHNNTMGYPASHVNFANCEVPAVMCVWIRDRQARDNNGNCATPLEKRCTDADPGDNTDLCFADASRAPVSAHVPVGFASFPGDSEGAVHAHGFAWGPGSQSSRFKGNLLFYISMYDHLSQRGYSENVPLAPMCACANRMPTISRADCTEVDVDEVYRVSMNGGPETLSAERTSVAIDFNACDGATNNDLYSEVAQLYADDGEVLDAIRDYLVGPENNNDPSNCPTDL